MSTKAERGMKRTCQSPQCGSRFYDLSRDPVTCPICGTTYALAGSALAVAAASPVPAAEKVARKPAKKPAYAVESVKPEDAPEAEAEDALPAVEGEEEPAAAGEDETFLEEEEEEDGSDMTNIIGSPVAEPEEPHRGLSHLGRVSEPDRIGRGQLKRPTPAMSGFGSFQQNTASAAPSFDPTSQSRPARMRPRHRNPCFPGQQRSPIHPRYFEALTSRGRVQVSPYSVQLWPRTSRP